MKSPEPSPSRRASLLAGEVTAGFAYPDAILGLAAVSSWILSVLIIASPADQRAPFEATCLTIKADLIDPMSRSCWLTGPSNWIRSG